MKKDIKEKKWSELSNETKTVIGTGAAVGIMDAILPKQPPQKGTGELLSSIIWVAFLVRVFVLEMILFYIFPYFIVSGTDVENPQWVTFQFAYIPFFLTVLYCTKVMYERKHHISMLVVNTINFYMLYYIITN